MPRAASRVERAEAKYDVTIDCESRNRVRLRERGCRDDGAKNEETMMRSLSQSESRGLIDCAVF